jgi:hypothetical protein
MFSSDTNVLGRLYKLSIGFGDITKLKFRNKRSDSGYGTATN